MTKTEPLTHIVGVPNAPPIPGLVFRAYRGESDLPSIVAISNACKAADQIEEVDTVESIQGRFQPSDNFDPQRDAFVVEIDGVAVAFGRLWWRAEDSGAHVYLHVGGVRPAWRRKGIGRALFRLKERRLRDIAAAHPKDVPRFLQVFMADTETGSEALARSEGYVPVRHFFTMVRPTLDHLPEARLPDGLEVRPVVPDHYRSIWVAIRDAFRDHWGAFSATEWHYRNWLNDPSFDPTLWKAAWDGDQVAGVVLGVINAAENERFQRRRGWLEDVAVRRPWRKRGLARALMVQTLDGLKERGMAEAALGVDTENLSGALRLYESAGFHVVKRFSAYRKPVD